MASYGYAGKRSSLVPEYFISWNFFSIPFHPQIGARDPRKFIIPLVGLIFGALLFLVFTKANCDPQEPPTTLKALEKYLSLRAETCQSYFDHGLNQSQDLFIDPDFIGPVMPFLVLCNALSSKKKIGFNF